MFLDGRQTELLGRVMTTLAEPHEERDIDPITLTLQQHRSAVRVKDMTPPKRLRRFPPGGRGTRLQADLRRLGRAEEWPRLAAMRPARPASGLAKPVPRRPLGQTVRYVHSEWRFGAVEN